MNPGNGKLRGVSCGCDSEVTELCLGPGRQTDSLGREVMATLSAGGKREEERFVVAEEPPKTAGAERFHSPGNQSEACRRHRCLCVKNLLLPCCSHPTCSFFSEVKGCDDQRGSLEKAKL